MEYEDFLNYLKPFLIAAVQNVTNQVNDVDMVSSCVPFVSQYTDCTEDNLCTGCTKCECTVHGQWSCERFSECQKETRYVDEKSLDNALDVITSELKNKKKSKTSSKKQRRLQKYPDDIILVNNDHIEDKILSLITRQKRSANFKTNNDGRDSIKSVRFHHTLDEVNEDTLKNSNLSGTLEAKKVALSPELTRRHGVLSHSNLTSMNSLNIEYKQPKIYNHHIADNKIDTSHVEEKYDALVEEKIHKIVGNHTNEAKDKDVSKIVVNELKNGTEILGNNKGPVMSNITFTPENDTFTAMAFIAGNLLNRLWELEKDSSDSFETEVLKHDKIIELLDLFKEPHTLKQEGFIRTALEKISEAIDRNKDVKNISLCENLEAAKKVINGSDSPNETSSKDCASRKKNDGGDGKLATKQAIKKINNVLDLIKKFEIVQKNLLDLKHSTVDFSNKNVEIKKKDPKTDKLSSQDLFFNLLETITKLLMPENQKLAKKIKSQTKIVDVENFKAKIKQMYNIDLGNVTLTPKDKLLLNYLNKVEKNPRCLLGSSTNNDEKSIRKVEGDILLNLSEFFKMKSFVDLMKMLEPEKKDTLRTYEVTTLKSWQVSRNMSVLQNNSNKIDDGKFVNTKEKLKAHLKVILDDLIEIQKEKQMHGNNVDTNLANALPCIYKVLNSDNTKLKNYETNDNQQINEIISVFDSLKKDLRFNSQTRRTTTDDQQRPTSSFVWERVINSLNSKYNKISRRYSNVQIPKTYEEIKKEIDKVDASSSNTYKTYDFLTAVQPADRLILLKTINMDVKKYKNVLEDIKTSYEDLEKLPPHKWNEICDFIENAGMQLNLDKNLFNTLKKSDERKGTDKSVKKRIHKEVIDKNMSAPKRYINNVKISRDQILNHIIKNRIQLYIKLKEANEDHVEGDISYNIAKKILAYLENGNNELAKELYKVFVIHKKSSTSNNKIESFPSNINQSMRVSNSFLYKRPLLQFEDPNNNMNIQQKMNNQDSLLKQLLNIKNFKLQQ